jgi:hypothetical protein
LPLNIISAAALDRFQQLQKVLTNIGIKLLCELAGETTNLNQLLHVGKVFQAIGAVIPDASFNSINFSRVGNLTPSISTEASEGLGKLTGFGLPSPGYSPATITSIGVPSVVARKRLFLQVSNQARQYVVELSSAR